MIFDGKICENCNLEGVSGAPGNGLAGLVVDFRARSPPKEPKTLNLSRFWGPLGCKLEPRWPKLWPTSRSWCHFGGYFIVFLGCWVRSLQKCVKLKNERQYSVFQWFSWSGSLLGGSWMPSWKKFGAIRDLICDHAVMIWASWRHVSK